jgi:crossover junction endodeoxyribonuclease RuvC
LIILGIDPGLSGGLAIIKVGDARQLLFAGDVPTTGEKAKKRVQVGAVLDILQKYKPTHALIERAQAMPDQGASSGFNYGRAVGSLEACVQGMQIPLTVIESTAWKKFHGLIKTEKEDSRQRAIMLYPAAPFFPLKRHHNLAEATLIADYGISLLSGAPRPKIVKPPPKAAQLDLIAE